MLVECWRTLVECWRTLVERWQNVGERRRTFSKTQILSEGRYRWHQKVFLGFRGFSEISPRARNDLSYLVTQRVTKFAKFQIEHWWIFAGTLVKRR